MLAGHVSGLRQPGQGRAKSIFKPAKFTKSLRGYYGYLTVITAR